MQPIHSEFACFCWAWPLSLLLLRWSLFGRDANLAGGFAGRRFVVFFGRVLWFLRFSGLLLVHGHSVMHLFSFYHFYFLSGPSLRQHRPHQRRKKRTLRGAGTFHLRFTLVYVSHHDSILRTVHQAECLLLVCILNSLVCIARSQG